MKKYKYLLPMLEMLGKELDDYFNDPINADEKKKSLVNQFNGIKIADLYFKNQELENRIKELESKLNNN